MTRMCSRAPAPAMKEANLEDVNAGPLSVTSGILMIAPVSASTGSSSDLCAVVQTRPDVEVDVHAGDRQGLREGPALVDEVSFSPTSTYVGEKPVKSVIARARRVRAMGETGRSGMRDTHWSRRWCSTRHQSHRAWGRSGVRPAGSAASGQRPRFAGRSGAKRNRQCRLRRSYRAPDPGGRALGRSKAPLRCRPRRPGWMLGGEALGGESTTSPTPASDPRSDSSDVVGSPAIMAPP